MIRKAIEKDISKIGDLLSQVDLVHHNGRPDIFKIGKKYSDEELKIILKDEQRPILVCVDEKDEVLGYCFCIYQQHTNNSVLTDIKTLYIDDLCVDENFRGRHIGKELYNAAVDLAKKVDSNLIIGTDPDSDRIGIMVRKGDEYVPITGNQLGVIMLDYIINAKLSTGTMPENPAVITSIVSTAMVRAVAEKNNVHFEDTFTGFKFMAERIAQWEAANSYKYIFSFEESYGYMVGDYVRDKDAVTAAMLVAEMAAHYHKKGMTLLDAMYALYEKYGWYKECTINLVMPGLDGLQKMQALMAKLRNEPPMELGGEKLARLRDYKDGTIFVNGLGKVDKTPIVGSDVLYFEMADGSNFIIRPSGTEPKIKIYLLVRGDNEAQCDERIERYQKFAMSLCE